MGCRPGCWSREQPRSDLQRPGAQVNSAFRQAVRALTSLEWQRALANTVPPYHPLAAVTDIPAAAASLAAGTAALREDHFQLLPGGRVHKGALLLQPDFTRRALRSLAAVGSAANSPGRDADS